jgi:hypothetical protein
MPSNIDQSGASRGSYHPDAKQVEAIRLINTTTMTVDGVTDVGEWSPWIRPGIHV